MAKRIWRWVCDYWPLVATWAVLIGVVVTNTECRCEVSIRSKEPTAPPAGGEEVR